MASGLSSSTLTQEGQYWKAKGPEGTVKIRFTPYNPFGVMDHWIDTGSGKEIYMPMRVIANEQGAEVVMVVYRQPLMSDEKFAGDVAGKTRSRASPASVNPLESMHYPPAALYPALDAIAKSGIFSRSVFNLPRTKRISHHSPVWLKRHNRENSRSCRTGES